MSETIIYWVGQMEYDSYNRPLSPANWDDVYYATHQRASARLDELVFNARTGYEKEYERAASQNAKLKAEWDALFAAGLREKSWDEIHPEGFKFRKFHHDYSIEESRLIG